MTTELNSREIEIRAAAFIDGEGSISIRTRLDIVCNVTSTDRRLPEWFMQYFGGSIYAGKGELLNPNAKKSYRWTLASNKAETFLKRIRPFLMLKHEQADIALTYWEHRRANGFDVMVAKIYKSKINELNKRGVK